MARSVRMLVAGCLVGGLVWGAPALAAAEFKARGFTLPGGAVKVDDHRYRLPQTYEEALKWYRGTYPPAKYPRRTLVNQGGVRAMHLRNPKPGDPKEGEWEGANVYEFAKGEVRVYILAPPQEDEGEAATPAPRKAQ